MDLFADPEHKAPLAERLRPKTLEFFIGQKHLLGEGKPLGRAIESGKIPSIIFWGPPGVGKTTLAQIIALKFNKPYRQLSAVSSGVKEVREVLEFGRSRPGTILFIDEIHRFNKSQQDSLLGAVEKGEVTLIGATTENPSFEVNGALLSRCQVYKLEPLSIDEVRELLEFAILHDPVLKTKEIHIQEISALYRITGGDARKCLNLLEIFVNYQPDGPIYITDESLTKVANEKIALYDKSGEQHYDIISAFIKSVRGSDPNASVYWLARMLEGGEDVKFIARRLIILASEDIGNANPNALLLATSGFDAVHKIGMPEARIILSQVTTYLACSAKSNSSYLAIDEAVSAVRETGDLPVPLHLRNAPTSLMKNMGYGKEYKYSHDFQNEVAHQEFLPESISGTVFYRPKDSGREKELGEFLKRVWGNKYSIEE